MSRCARWIVIAAGTGFAASLGACASVVEESAPATAPPAWFSAAADEAGAQGFPSLSDVPAAPRVAPASDPRWEALEAELVTEGASLQGDERASPAPANAEAEADAFRAEAVRALEDTRSRY